MPTDLSEALEQFSQSTNIEIISDYTVESNVIKDFNDDILSFFTKYPKLKKPEFILCTDFLQEVDFHSGGYYSPSLNIIAIKASGFSGLSHSTFCHEIGHLMHYQKLCERNEKTLFIECPDVQADLKDDIRSFIRDYATTNQLEFVAEFCRKIFTGDFELEINENGVATKVLKAKRDNGQELDKDELKRLNILFEYYRDQCKGPVDIFVTNK